MQQLTIGSEFPQNKEISIAEIFYKYLSFWPFFLVLLLISTSLAWVYLRYKLPVYQSTATLLIKDDKSSNPGKGLEDAFDMFGSKKNVENEIKVLQSKTLMREVVENLHLYAPITVEGRVTNQSGYVSSPIVIEVNDPDSIIAVDKIPFAYNDASQSLTIENAQYNLNHWYTTPFGVLQFLPNKFYHHGDKSGEKYKYYFSIQDVKNTANGYLGALKISSSSQESSVIDLSINDQVAQRGGDILNELLSVYNEAAILDKNMLASNTLKFVQGRLKFVVNELDSVEGQLQNFKSHNKITDISEQGKIYLQTVASND